MKTQMKLGIFFLGLSLVVACDPIRGTLQVNRSFEAKAGSSFSSAAYCSGEMYPCGNETQSISIPVGQHNMKVDMITRKDAQLLIKVGKTEHKIELSIPDGKQIPATGSISISAQESGQPFDLHAQTQTDVSRTELERDLESCEIVWQERVCGIRPGKSGKGSDVKDEKPVYECWTETFRKPGTQDVEFFYETTTQHMQAQIQQSGSQVASFSGLRTNTEKIYTYKGTCFERHF
jgi:hypothetical protein